MNSPLHPSILCIDDDESSLKIRELLLEVSGYNVFTAVSGAEGEPGVNPQSRAQTQTLAA